MHPQHRQPKLTTTRWQSIAALKGEAYERRDLETKFKLYTKAQTKFNTIVLWRVILNRTAIVICEFATKSEP